MLMHMYVQRGEGKHSKEGAKRLRFSVCNGTSIAVRGRGCMCPQKEVGKGLEPDPAGNSA